MSSAEVRNTIISPTLGRRTGSLNVTNCGKTAIICEIISMHLAAQANTAAKEGIVLHVNKFLNTSSSRLTNTGLCNTYSR